MVVDTKETSGERDEARRLRQVSVRDGEIDSRELFQSERELHIRHGDDTYRLRLTGLNKLILTK
jgi:hemin uptake protein HemP